MHSSSWTRSFIFLMGTSPARMTIKRYQWCFRGGGGGGGGNSVTTDPNDSQPPSLPVFAWIPIAPRTDGHIEHRNYDWLREIDRTGWSILFHVLALGHDWPQEARWPSVFPAPEPLLLLLVPVQDLALALALVLTWALVAYSPLLVLAWLAVRWPEIEVWKRPVVLDFWRRT